jgi:hypothetical protein
LIRKGKEMEDEREMKWLRGNIEVNDEMDEMRNEYEEMKIVKKVNIKEMFVNENIRIKLMIEMMVMVEKKMYGINDVMLL